MPRPYLGVYNVKPAEERFWAKVQKLDGGCWLWTGRLFRGYGRIYWLGRERRAHRVALWLVKGIPLDTDPASSQPDHTCRNRACVNPDHLEMVTRVVNVMRGESPAAINARKTQCPNGHPYDRIKGGRRICDRCYRETERAYNQRREGVPL